MFDQGATKKVDLKQINIMFSEFEMSVEDISQVLGVELDSLEEVIKKRGFKINKNKPSEPLERAKHLAKYKADILLPSFLKIEMLLMNKTTEAIVGLETSAKNNVAEILKLANAYDILQRQNIQRLEALAPKETNFNEEEIEKRIQQIVENVQKEGKKAGDGGKKKDKTQSIVKP